MTFAITRPHPEQPGTVQFAHIYSGPRKIIWTDKTYQAKLFRDVEDARASGLYLPAIVLDTAIQKLPLAGANAS